MISNQLTGKNLMNKNQVSELIASLQKIFGFSVEFLNLLLSKNLRTPSQIRKFLNPKISDLKNPFLIHDMKKAVLRMQKAIKNNEKILIYGDKDVDGQTSVSLLRNILQDYGLVAEFYIPYDEGYGLHKNSVNLLLQKKIDLLITVDCGITNNSEIELINSHGIDVIVLDHHEVIGDLPRAVAVVDPKILVPSYDSDTETLCLKSLAGCGVVFYFGWALKMSYAPYFDKKIVAIDLETTGLNPQDDKIIEIGASVFENGLEIDKFQRLVNPGQKISRFISELTTITNEELSKAKILDEILPDFVKFLEQADLILIHNAKFDLGFLQKLENESLNSVLNSKKMIDTCELTKILYPNISHKLADLAKIFHLETKVLHRAYDDAELTQRLYRDISFKSDYAIMHYFKKYIIFSALGTISDVMPLTGDNRFLVKHGLTKLKNTNILSLKMLIEEMIDDHEKLTAKYISWNITPMLNSAGRMGKADLAVEFLCSNDEACILELRDKIMELNKARKNIQTRDQKLVEKLISVNYNQLEKFIFVVHQSLNKNVSGLVASSFVKKCKKPVFIATQNGDEIVGSVRAPEGSNIVYLLEKSKDFLMKFGGHKLAGGFTLKLENLADFAQNLKILLDDSAVFKDKAELNFDLELKAEEISEQFIRELFLLEPFGEGNRIPILFFKDVKFEDFGFIGTDKSHFKGSIKTRDGIIETIGWSFKEKLNGKNSAEIFNFTANFEKDFYNGKARVRLNILEIF